MALNKPHSGVILKVESREYKMIKKFSHFSESLEKKQGNLIVLLDQIIDPFNLASIIRTSYFYVVNFNIKGANRIILNKKNSPPISPAVSYVSLGASECADLYQVKFLQNFLEGSN